nr:APH(3'') family aminoglycoside O-phosphotransferase [uncultured Dyadobacter sp.]
MITNSDPIGTALLPRLPAGVQWVSVNNGESGDRVYRRTDDVAYAKISTGQGLAALSEERRRSAWLHSQNISCPEVLDWTVSGETACLVTRAIAGLPASELSPTQLLAAWPSIARQYKMLHALRPQDCPFHRDLRTMFGKATDIVARNAVNPEFLDPEDEHVPPVELLSRLENELPARLAQEAGDLVVCHGDACMPNIMVDPASLQCTGLIDLGRLGVADRYADLALLLGNTRETWENAAQAQKAHAILFETLGPDQADIARLHFYLRLDPLTWG